MLRKSRNPESSADAPPPKAAKAPKPPKQKRPKAGVGPGAARQKGKGKGSKFVLLIGDDGAILVFMQGTTVVRRLFAPSPQPDHTASIIDMMRTHPKVPLYILADVLDQQYVRHTFPPVSSLSVGGLVKRRLDRDFQAEDLKGSLPLGRDKTGRKEWNYLLIALAYTPLMQQWLEVIVEQPNEMKGIYLLPVEAQNYIPALKKELGGEKMPWQLLVTHNKVSGFRQVVLKDGKLVFTRVTQAIDDGATAVIAGNIEQEIINSIEYLRRLGFTENSTLEIIVVTAQEVKEVLDLNRFQAGMTHVLAPLDVADMLGLQQAALSADRFGDVVVASWFGRAKKRTLKLQTAYGQSLAKLYAARRAIVAITALAALGCVGMGGMNLVAMKTASDEAEQVELQQAPLRAQVEEQQKSLSALDQDITFKSAVVAVHDAYLKNDYDPLDFVEELAPFMSDTVRVQDFSWAPVATASNASTPPPMPGAGPIITGPLEIKLSIEFLEKYKDVESLTLAVDRYVAELKKNMPRYDIVAAPYSWMGNATALEISLDQQQSQTLLSDATNRIELTVHGPAPATEAAAQPAPGAP